MKEIGAGQVRIPGLVARCGWVITVLCWYGVLIGGSTLVARFRGSPRGRGLYDIPLARLTDGAKPPSPRRIERAARLAYVDRPWPFREFGWQPVASGSIATDGRRVAVKLRHPGIEGAMRRDFWTSHPGVRWSAWC